MPDQTIDPLDQKVQDYITEHRKSFKDEDIARSLAESGKNQQWISTAMKGRQQSPGLLGNIIEGGQELGHNLADAAGGVWSGLKSIFSTHPGDPVPNIPSNLIETGLGAVKGAWNQNAQEMDRIGKMYPNSPIDRYVGQAIGGIPIVGPGLNKAAEGIASGHYGKGIVDWLSAVAEGVEPEDLGAALTNITKPLRAASENTFTKAMKYPKTMSLEDMKSTTKLALENGFRPKNQQMIDAVGHIDKPGSFLHSLDQEVSSAIAPHATEKIPRSEIVQQLQAEINKLNPGQEATAATRKALEDWIDEFTTQTVPAQPASQTLGANGLPLIPAQPARKVPKGDIMVGDAQEMARSINREMAPSVYSDTPTAAPDPAIVRAKNLQLKGLRSALEKRVPELHDLNGQMHNAIQLHDQLELLEKSHPGMHFDALPMVGALAAGAGGAYVHAPLAGNALAAMITLRELLKSPKSGTALAAALAHVGQDPLTQAIRYGPRAAGLFDNIQRPTDVRPLNTSPQNQSTQ